MSDETQAAAAATTEQATTQAPSEQATPAEVIRDVDAPMENAESQEQVQEQEQPAEETAPKKQSTSDRYRRKISAQAGIIDRIDTERRELAEKLAAMEKSKATDDEPNPADYPNGEWDSGYIADKAAQKAVKAVNSKLDERTQSDEQKRQADAAKTQSQKLEESAAKARERLTDFDETIKTFLEDGGEFAPHVKAAINASGDKAALIIYNLAKDGDLADRLNGMSKDEVLIEIGEIRAKATLPERKTTPKAPAPLRTVTGGAAATLTVHDLAKSDDVTAYVEARRKKAG